MSRSRDSIVAAALEIAEDFPVFPCNADKRPITAHGFKDATRDPEEVEKLFRKPGARLIGVPTGEPSGLVVIDADVKNGAQGQDWLDANRTALSLTRRHRTRSGGTHVIYRGANIGCSASKVHPGVDVRADGGYVIWPPSEGYTIEADEEIEPLPAALKELLTATLDATRNGTPPDTSTDPFVAYGRQHAGSEDDPAVALESACQAISEAPSGTQEQTLNNNAIRLSRFVLNGQLRLDDTANALIAAAMKMKNAPGRAPWARRQIEGKIMRALADGLNTEEARPQADRDPARGTRPSPVRVLSFREFTDGFVAPDYLVDGVIQKRYLYSTTALTGHGKTAVALLLAFAIASGTGFAGHDVEQGRVLFLAGENPDDVCARCLIMADLLGVDRDSLPLDIVRHPFNVKTCYDIVQAQLADRKAALVVVDTAASFFTGTDENSNVEQGRFARQLRNLTKWPGGPCVLVTSHPTKAARKDSLVPRGGGAFLNEVDGNLTLWSADKEITELSWQGKLRGPGFEPMTFRLQGGLTSETVKDSKGRLIPSVVAEHMSEDDVRDQTKATRSDEDNLIETIHLNPRATLAEWATYSGWTFANGKPAKSKVQRTLERLKIDGLAKPYRGTWKLTDAGRKEAERITGKT
jgi:hypothetical protein